MLPKLSTRLGLSGCTFIIQLFLQFLCQLQEKLLPDMQKTEPHFLKTKQNFRDVCRAENKQPKEKPENRDGRNKKTVEGSMRK